MWRIWTQEKDEKHQRGPVRAPVTLRNVCNLMLELEDRWQTEEDLNPQICCFCNNKQRTLLISPSTKVILQFSCLQLVSRKLFVKPKPFVSTGLPPPALVTIDCFLRRENISSGSKKPARQLGRYDDVSVSGAFKLRENETINIAWTIQKTATVSNFALYL